MKIMKVSDFFNNNISPFVLGSFFSRYVFTDDKKYIYTYGYFKNTTVIKTDIVYKDYVDEYVKVLNEESKPFPYWDFYTNYPKNIQLS